MKKILMVLMMAFTMATGLFADVYLIPEDKFNNCIVSAYEDIPFIQPQIAYIAFTWEDVYEKTGVGKYGWTDRKSMYCDITIQFCLLVKVRVKDTGELGWICYEFSGDGSETMYTADVEY